MDRTYVGCCDICTSGACLGKFRNAIYSCSLVDGPHGYYLIPYGASTFSTLYSSAARIACDATGVPRDREPSRERVLELLLCSSAYIILIFIYTA